MGGVITWKKDCPRKNGEGKTRKKAVSLVKNIICQFWKLEPRRKKMEKKGEG